MHLLLQDNPTEVVDLECEDDQNVSERTFKEETSFAQCQGLEIVSGDVGTQLSELTESSLTEDNATVQGEVQGDVSVSDIVNEQLTQLHFFVGDFSG